MNEENNVTESGPVNSNDDSIANGLFDLVKNVMTEKREQQDAAGAFDPLHEHDSTPSLEEPVVQKISDSEMAQALNDIRVQGYIEANFGIQALKLIQSLVPLLLGAA